MDKELKQTTLEFLDAFENVFDKDWEYSKEMMGVSPRTEEQMQFDNQMGLEAINIIAEDGTFLNPKADFESDNWGNRSLLLEKYRKLKKILNEIEE